jgi:hypothetical protein
MRRLSKLGAIAAAVLGLLALLIQPAQAQQREIAFPFFGNWRITDAKPAPWTGGKYTFDPFASRALIGKRVIFAFDVIDAPFPLGCDEPDYRTIDVPPEALFQGNLSSPILQAHALGFRPGAPVTPLLTGCEHDIDYHFVDRATAMFALDNMVFTLRRR